MSLFAVIVTNVYPRQCVTISDNRKACDRLADHLSGRVSPNVTVEQVDSIFIPKGMAPADQAWMDAKESYFAGHHINTSGERE